MYLDNLALLQVLDEWNYHYRRLIFSHIPISKSQFLALLNLATKHEKGMTVAELSRQIFMTSGNCTRLANDLKNNGYIIKKRRSDDQRIVDLFITDKGRAVLLESEHLFEKTISKVRNKIGTTDIIQFEKTLQVILDYAASL